MAEEESKKKRRIRPASDTIRVKTEKARVAADKPKSLIRSRNVVGAAGKPLRFIAKPIKWLGRHLIPSYFRNSYAELRLVTWPNWKQSRQLTTAVVLFAVIFGFIVSILDFGLDKIFKKVFLK